MVEKVAVVEQTEQKGEGAGETERPAVGEMKPEVVAVVKTEVVVQYLSPQVGAGRTLGPEGTFHLSAPGPGSLGKRHYLRP